MDGMSVIVTERRVQNIIFLETNAEQVTGSTDQNPVNYSFLIQIEQFAGHIDTCLVQDV